jgi:hypothetical protein
MDTTIYLSILCSIDFPKEDERDLEILLEYVSARRESNLRWADVMN